MRGIQNGIISALNLVINMKKITFFLLCFLCIGTEANAALSLDGNCTNSNTSNTINCSLTTADTNDVIVLEIFTNPSSGSASVSSVSGGGLTWTKRTAQPWAVTAINYDMEIWWASASSPLIAQTITANVTGSNSANRLVVLGVNGANLSVPFDANAGVPQFTHGELVNTLTNTISTTNPNTLLIAFTRYSGTTGYGTITRPSGFTQLVATGGFADISTSIVSSAQSSVAETLSWTTIGASNVTTGYIIDAIQQASTAPVGGLLLDTGF